MINNGPLVYIIIINFNGLKYLEACLSSLEVQTYTNYRIVFFDNASTDGSSVFVRSTFPNVIIVSSDVNLGFAEGNNLAVEHVLNQKPDYIFFLNNDTTVEKELLAKLVTTFESDDSIGIVGSAVYDYNNKNVALELGMSIDRFGYPLALRNSELNDESKVFFVSGCSLMIRRSVLERIGLFDDRYFMFAEDLDLCWRAQLAGFKIVMDRSARVFHASGGSISGGALKTAHYKTNIRRIFFREKNTLRTLLKNYDSKNVLAISFFYAGLILLECLFWSVTFKPRTALSILKALFWNLKFFPDTWRRRMWVQSLRVVGDKSITKKMVDGYGKLHVFRVIGMPHFVNSNN
jgi:GT2 family glycosyltransferase